MKRLEALLSLLALDRLPRTGWLQHSVPVPESIAGHVLGSAQLALLLAPLVDPPPDVARLLALVLLHDAPEALTGDLPRAAAAFLPAGAKRSMEAGAARVLLEPLGPESMSAWEEYAAGQSREARLARACDGLQLGLRTLGYVRAGVRGLENFRAGLERLSCQEFPPAEELRRELLDALEEAGG